MPETLVDPTTGFLDVFSMYDSVIMALERLWLPDVGDKERFYGWVPYPTPVFLNQLQVLQRFRPNGKFLEVGCGIGTKLALASLAGFECTGIELRPEYVDVCRAFMHEMNLSHVVVEQADARAWTRWAEFDIIYMYWPIIDVDEEIVLEKSVMKQVKPDALLFWPTSAIPMSQGWHQKGPYGIWEKDSAPAAVQR